MANWGRSPEQIEKRRYYARNRARNRKDCIRKHKLKKEYNLTPEDYDRMFKAQDGRCAICKEEERIFRNGVRQRLAIDHDHLTKIIRGLLCRDCNQGIGKFYDEILRLQSAIEYLKKYPRE